MRDRNQPNLASSGYGDFGRMGDFLDFQPETWIFIEVLEGPTGDWTGMTWEQRLPMPDGTWAVPDATLGIILSGNNGGTGQDRRNPAFVLGGGVVATGATAYAVRGYQDGAETSGGTGQEWLILGLVSGCSGTCTPPDDGRTYTSQGTACQLVIDGFTCSVDTMEIVNTRTVVCFTSPVEIKTSTSTAAMPPCPAGTAATIDVNSTTTLTAGSDATVTNVGTSTAALLDFGIPRGFDGNAGTIAVGSVSALSPGSTPTVTNVGTSTAAIFNFGIPAGTAGSVGATGATGGIGATGGTGSIGATGPSITLTIGTVSTVSPGGAATANVTGTTPNYALDLGIPAGTAGAPGTGSVSGATGAFVSADNFGVTVSNGLTTAITPVAPNCAQYVEDCDYTITGVSGTGSGTIDPETCIVTITALHLNITQTTSKTLKYLRGQFEANTDPC